MPTTDGWPLGLHVSLVEIVEKDGRPYLPSWAILLPGPPLEVPGLGRFAWCASLPQYIRDVMETEARIKWCHICGSPATVYHEDTLTRGGEGTGQPLTETKKVNGYCADHLPEAITLQPRDKWSSLGWLPVPNPVSVPVVAVRVDEPETKGG